MSAALILVLVVVVAYLATHVAYDWIARRLMIVSGAEYLILGILLGPQVSGIFSAPVVSSFGPFITLALGWIGVIVGMQFFLPTLVAVAGLTYRVAFGEALTTLAVVTGAELLLLRWSLGGAPEVAVGPAVALGAIACVSTPAGIAIAARRLQQRGPLVRQLEITTAVDALVAITTLGLLLCFIHPVGDTPFRPPTVTEWAVITVAIGAIGGALFHLFLGDERKIDRLFVSLAGAVTLTSGAAAYLGLSPLLAAMVMGFMLVNTSRNREEIASVLTSAERPFYFVMLIFAGATWQPSVYAWALPVLVFLAARATAKLAGARLATRWNGALPMLGGDWGRALLGQGGLAIALALDYARRDDLPAPNIVFTAALASVLLTDFSAPRLVESVLRPFRAARR